MKFIALLSLLAVWITPFAATGQPPLPATQALPPPPPLPTSPVYTFRHLLALPPRERTQALASRTQRQREFLEGHLAAYEAMPSALRDERLRATDLYWHLQQLIRRAPSERTTLLASVPRDLQPVLNLRLAFWDQLPAEDRSVLLENESTLRYLAQMKASVLPPLPTHDNPRASVAAAPPIPLRVQANLDRLNQLPSTDLERIQLNWGQFFEGPTPRRERALLEMSNHERREMEQVLDRFQRLTPEQRRTCVGSFTRLAGMDPAERSDFLRHAARWSALDPAERHAWRQIVNKLPLLPPLPNQATEPPLPTSPTVRRVANHGAGQ